MKIIATFLIATLVQGCATPLYKDPMGNPPLQKQILECEFEADKAVTPILNSFERGYMRGEFKDKCMQIKGFKLTYK